MGAMMGDRDVLLAAQAALLRRRADLPPSQNTQRPVAPRGGPHWDRRPPWLQPMAPALSATLERLEAMRCAMRDDWDEPSSHVEARARYRLDVPDLPKAEVALSSAGCPSLAMRELSTARTRDGRPLVRHDEAERRLQQLVWSGCRLIVLSGERGTGKTLLACRVVAAVALPAVYIKAGGYVAMATRQREDRLEARRVAEVPMLVLDECGEEGEMGRSVVASLIRERWDDQRRSVYVTNLPPSVLRGMKGTPSYYGDPVSDRIATARGVVHCANRRRG